MKDVGIWWKDIETGFLITKNLTREEAEIILPQILKRLKRLNRGRRRMMLVNVGEEEFLVQIVSNFSAELPHVSEGEEKKIKHWDKLPACCRETGLY